MGKADLQMLRDATGPVIGARSTCSVEPKAPPVDLNEEAVRWGQLLLGDDLRWETSLYDHIPMMNVPL